ncbi:MAG: ABC transporter permease [Candidatus Aminicenantales bacterium]
MNPGPFPPEPPGVVRRLIRFLLRHEDADGREAEFDALFEEETRRRGLESARRAYRIQFVFSLPGLIANFIIWEAAMLKNYLTIGWRNIVKHKGISLINFVGLALGMACALLIFIWVDGEMRTDRSQPNGDRVFRLEEGDWADLQTSYRKVLATFPEIEKFVQFSSWEKPILQVGDRLFDSRNLVFADDTVFDVFEFKFLRGSSERALAEPYSLVLTLSEARRLFGAGDPMGKTVVLDNAFPFTVTGVVEDPDDFHLEWRAMGPFKSLPAVKGRPNFLDGHNDNFPTYILLRPQTNVAALTRKLTVAINAIRGADGPAVFRLRPFRDIYFARDMVRENGVKHGNMNFVVLFSAVAVLVLLIACVNFINLVTARSSSRAKEISVRKAAGAMRKNLLVQFLGETSLTVFGALALALVLVVVFLPYFARLTGEPLDVDWTAGKWLGGILSIFLFTSIVSGLGPALYLSSLEPVALMKGRSPRPARRAPFRTVLTVFQFAVATFLIIGALIVLGQVDYLKAKGLGFDREHVLLVPLKGELKETPQVLRARIQGGKTFGETKGVFKRRLLQSPDIRGVTFIGQSPGELTTTNTWRVRGEKKPMIIMQTDPDFIDVMGLKLVEGRNLSWDLESDMGLSYLVNEEAVPFLKLDPLFGETFQANFGQSQVVGVVKNFHFQSLHQRIGPMAVVWFDAWTDTAVIKVSGTNIAGAIAHIRDVWGEVSPNAPFSYTFMDETVGRLYAAEARLGRILKVFVGIAVFLSCLGLFGLSAYVAVQKTKEIGIRKVLGAKASEIVILLSKDFCKWVLFANLFAWPAAYYVSEKWLQGFAYRIRLGLGPFLLAAVSSLLVALLTISYQSVKAATANPVEAIRYE